jgi:hypothetical protein
MHCLLPAKSCIYCLLRLIGYCLRGLTAATTALAWTQPQPAGTKVEGAASQQDSLSWCQQEVHCSRPNHPGIGCA